MCWSHSCPFLFAELFYHDNKGEPVAGSTEDSASSENMKPSFTKKLKFQSVVEGEPVQLKCKLTACPAPTILWFHNNRSISKERRRRICSDSSMHIHTTSLVIDSIREKDSGSYKVMAINTEGSAESTASLLVSLREEQPANYLGLVSARRSARSLESIDTMAEQRKERKIRVDLRCVGSPFDKTSKVHQGRSRSKSALVRTVYFRSGSHLTDKESEKRSKCLETASERALSPTPMFDRSGGFNDRFSDIYCDRRTGRFSDKFSDRCSDRYSERFSDTESLHNEVRTKLNTLQKAVKQKKRLSISTMSSSEFELESVASEMSYTDYVERLRVKPASLPDVQHFNRPFDLGEANKEFQGKASSRDPTQPSIRHSFEPQSRSRAMQLMKGELLDTLVSEAEKTSSDKRSETLEDKNVKSFAEMQTGVVRSVADDHEVEDGIHARHLEVSSSQETTTYTEIREPVRSVSSQEAISLVHSTRPKTATSTVQKFLREDMRTSEAAEPREKEFAGESLRAHYEKSLEAERMECEEKLLALRIRKWQQGSRMSEEEAFHPETDLPILSETEYMEPIRHSYSQQDKRTEPEVNPSSPHESPKKGSKVGDPGGVTASTPTSSSMKARSREVERTTVRIGLEEKEDAPLVLTEKSPRIKAAEAESSPRTKDRPDNRFRRSDAKGTEQAGPGDEFGESFRDEYEKSLESGQEEKLLALRIRKWQDGMRMSEEETFYPETALPADTQYMETEEHTPREAVEKKITPPQPPEVRGVEEQRETSAQFLKARMKSRSGEAETQKSPRLKAAAECESSPTVKAKAEKMRPEQELKLSRENISDLKSESEKFISEKEALTQRIRKWQQDVLIEQDQSAKLQGHSAPQAAKPTEAGEHVSEAHAVESGGVQHQEGESPRWALAGEAPAGGRETRLQVDSEYFVSEEEALAQRVLKWQQDAVEQEDVAELESEWALDSQSKQPGPVWRFEPHLPQSESGPQHGGTHESHSREPPPAHLFSTQKPSVLQPTVECEPSPSPESSIQRHPSADASLRHHVPDAPARGQRGSQASRVQRHSPTRLGSLLHEGHEPASASYESPHKPFGKLSPVRSEGPPCLSPQGDFQSEPREETGAIRESSEWKQQEDFTDMWGGEKSGELRDFRAQQGKEMSTDSFEKGSTKKEERGGQVESKLKAMRPVFFHEISSLNVKSGQMSEFVCQFQGDPPPTVSWLKDGHPLDHNPDYDIIKKSNSSKLTIFYPTRDHEGTYDCIITNKHGKSTCSASLKVSDPKEVRVSGVSQTVVKTQELQTEDELQERLIEEELQTYTDTGKATLQVPRTVILKHHRADGSASTSPVEIRITAATPVPEMGEERSEPRPEAFTERTAAVSGDDDGSQTLRHKFTFSFDVVGEAPCVVTELENITCSEGDTPVLKCVISGEPAPEVTWYHNYICLEASGGKYRAEVDEKTYRLHISSFTYAEAGVYQCVARNKLGEVSSTSTVSYHTDKPVWFSEGGVPTPPETGREPPFGFTEDFREHDTLHKSAFSPSEDSAVQTSSKPLSSQASADRPLKDPVSRPGLHGDPQLISGCGLQGSAAGVNVSQIKQAFESSSPVRLMATPPEVETEEIMFPKEFIPSVLISLDQQEQAGVGDQFEPPTTVNQGSCKASQAPVGPNKPASSETSRAAEVREEVSSAVPTAEFTEERLESPGLVRPEPRKPGPRPQLTEGDELEAAPWQTVHTFDRTGSFFAFQPEAAAVKRSARHPAQPEASAEPRQISEPLKSVSQRAAAAASSGRREAEVTSVTSYPDADAAEASAEEHVEHKVKGLEEALEFIPVLEHVSEEGERPAELVSFPEPSTHSGVFGGGIPRIPEFQNKTEVSEKTVVGDVLEPRAQMQGEDESTEARLEPETLIVKPKAAKAARPPGLPADAADQGRRGDGVDGARAGGAAGSIEEEEVTFGSVYDYYSPPSDWGRPLSPESEMSIEIGSTVSEDIAEVAERFYTPGSSTEVSHPIAQSFHTPKSPTCFQTPSSDAPGGFKTPREYPLSSAEYKKSSTGDSSEAFFSPVQFLTSPTDEGMETGLSGMNVDENQFLSQGRGSLGLSPLPEKVQGIPPAFLKPLIKKKVIENDSLTFHAEVFGLPSPEVKWFCNKTQLVADGRVSMGRDGDSISLTIRSVTKADQGEYICEAVNYVGEARSVALVVVVSREVTFMPAPPAVSHQHVMEFDVEEDDSSRSPSPQEILLEVELDENEVKEFERQVKIITIPEYTADNKSMIISLDVLPSIYEEGAVDFVTQEHDDLKIAFEVTEMPPRFINPICDMETPEGTTVMFECSLMGIPSPIVSWFRGDRKIPHDNKKYFHSSDGDNHFLKISKVTTQDSGIYTCRAINVVGETLCRASLVVVSAKAFSGKARGRELTAVSLGSAKVQPQKFDLMVGSTSLDGDQVSEIELEFDFEQEAEESQRAVRLVANTDSETSEQGQKYVSINFDVFAEPAKDDKIEFKGKSSDVCSFQFQVTETAPKCVIPLTNVTAAVGTPVILQCLVSGKPNPTAEWYKDGDPITDSRCLIQVKTAGHFNLLITNVAQSDAGEYKCRIQNSAGCIETTALLKVF